MRTLSALAVVTLALASSCEDEALAEIFPRILVCAMEDAPEDECNGAFELGERFITVEHQARLFVRNRGEAPLAVSLVEPSVSWAVVEPTSLAVPVNAARPLQLRFTPEELGEQEIVLTLASDDPDLPTLALPLGLLGTPKPVPVLELCHTSAAPVACGTGLTVDFGVVRRTQRESHTLVVRNVGDDPLSIDDVSISDRSSQPGELSVTTSTRPGVLAPGAEARVLLLYEPLDGEADELTLTFRSDDPATPEARVIVRARSEENKPPVALAEELSTGERNIEVTVADVVVLDGGASRDPEGDPLLYAWTLTVPVGSAAEIDDPEAGRVSFVPDVAGTYRAELVVTDSLGQASEVASAVLVQALPGAALRVRLSWTQGADVDLHFVPLGDALFGPTDTHFGNVRPDLGVQGDPADDPELLHDAESAPGVENIVYVAPAPGSYRVYAHYYDEGGAGPALAQVTMTLNDASFPVLDNSRTLQSGCALWHVADVEMPGGLVSNTGAGISSLCP